MSPAGPKALPRIFYASSSHRLALDVQSLLLRLGINARCKRIGQKGKGRDQFHVTVSGKPDIAAFVDRVGTVGTYRLEEITQIRHYLDGRRHNTNRDVIPRQVWHTMAVPAMERAGISQRQMQAGLGMQYCGTGLFKNHIGRQRAARLAQAVDSPEISALAASDIYWDEVVEIVADGCEEVYDLTVPHGHNFVAGDIIVHNSIEQDADVVMFIYRPDIYGLKSADGGSLEGLAEIIIGKQRNGPTGSVHLMWNAECASYENMASDWRVEPEEEY